VRRSRRVICTLLTGGKLRTLARGECENTVYLLQMSAAALYRVGVAPIRVVAHDTDLVGVETAMRCACSASRLPRASCCSTRAFR